MEVAAAGIDDAHCRYHAEKTITTKSAEKACGAAAIFGLIW